MENTRFCIKCGKEIPSNSEFCPYCGAAQSAINSGNASSSNNSTQARLSQQPVQNNITQPLPSKNSSNTGTYIGIGWLCAVVSLFIPITGIIGIVLGALAVAKSDKKTAAIVLIVFSCIFFYLGITGFGTGFINGISGH